MKTISKIALCGLLTLGVVSSSQAQTRVYIVGSTAFRAVANRAIMIALGSTDNGQTLSGVTSGSYGYVGSPASSPLVPCGSASQAIFSTPSVIVKTAFVGSESGIQSIVTDGTGIPQKFLADNTPQSPTGSSGASAGTYLNDLETPTAAFSDTYQGTSQFKPGAKIKFNGVGGDNKFHTMVQATEAGASPVGITYFSFVASSFAANPTSGTFTNITSAQARGLYINGSLPLALFMPGTTNTGATVFNLGRDPDSGTRLTVMGEIGAGNTINVLQFYPLSGTSTIIDASTAITSIAKVPASTVNQIPVSLGNGGYNSGGNLVLAVSNSTDSINWDPSPTKVSGDVLVGYAGISDIVSKLTNSARPIAFNGVSVYTGPDYTKASLGTGSNWNDAAVTGGQYPLWTYEHLYYGTYASTDQATFLETLASQVVTEAANLKGNGLGVIDRPSMNVHRSGTQDGGALIISGTF